MGAGYKATYRLEGDGRGRGGENVGFNDMVDMIDWIKATRGRLRNKPREEIVGDGTLLVFSGRKQPPQDDDGRNGANRQPDKVNRPSSRLIAAHAEEQH